MKGYVVKVRHNGTEVPSKCSIYINKSQAEREFFRQVGMLRSGFYGPLEYSIETITRQPEGIVCEIGRGLTATETKPLTVTSRDNVYLYERDL